MNAPPGCTLWLVFDLATGEIKRQGSVLGAETAKLQAQNGEGVLLRNVDWGSHYVNPSTKRIRRRPTLWLPATVKVGVGEEVTFEDLPAGTVWLRGFEDEPVIDDGELVVAYDTPGNHTIVLRPPFPFQPISIEVTVV